jgi:hypothetical protein
MRAPRLYRCSEAARDRLCQIRSLPSWYRDAQVLGRTGSREPSGNLPKVSAQ